MDKILEEVKANDALGLYKKPLKLENGDQTIYILETVYLFAANSVVGYATYGKDKTKVWFYRRLYYKNGKEPKFNLLGRSFRLEDFGKAPAKFPVAKGRDAVVREFLKLKQQR